MKIIDLSHVIETGMPVFPGTKDATITDAFTIKEDGFNEKMLNLLTHTGTHLDCPKHMIESRKTTDRMSVEHFFGPGWVYDCRKSLESRFITPDMIELDKLKKTDFALFYTGWNELWGDERYFKGFPTFSQDTITLLINHKIKAVGLDFISADSAESTDFENHKRLLSNDCLIVENLRGLERLFNKSFLFSCFPLKIKDGDGSPVRAVGII